jgi:hypothetical protein
LGSQSTKWLVTNWKTEVVLQQLLFSSVTCCPPTSENLQGLRERGYKHNALVPTRTFMWTLRYILAA